MLPSQQPTGAGPGGMVRVCVICVCMCAWIYMFLYMYVQEVDGYHSCYAVSLEFSVLVLVRVGGVVSRLGGVAFLLLLLASVEGVALLGG